MYVSMSQLSLVLIYSLLLGAFLCASYDVIRLLRITFGIRYKSVRERPFDFSSLRIVGKYIKGKAKKAEEHCFASVFVSIGDILFFVFSGVCISIFTYHFNSGEFRFFILFGAIVGFLSYYFTFGRLVLYLSSRIILGVKIALIYLTFFIFYPVLYVFLKIYRIFYSIIRKIILIMKKMYDIMYMYHYSHKMERKTLRNSRRGFLGEYKI